MGWCSATVIFDNVAGALLGKTEKQSPKDVLKALVIELEDGDWDCQQDSAYWDNPVVKEIFQELHPSWFEDDEI